MARFVEMQEGSGETVFVNLDTVQTIKPVRFDDACTEIIFIGGGSIAVKSSAASIIAEANQAS